MTSRDPFAKSTPPAAADLSRRALLSAAASAAILPALAGCRSTGTEPLASAPAPAPAPIPPATPVTGPLRIGLIGCGGRGTGAAVQALRADKNTRLVAMGDVLPDRLNACLNAVSKEMAEEAARVDVPESRRFVGFDSYQRVIDSGVDVVLLTSYPQFRPAHLAAAVAAGKHVFAEKPVAVDAPGVRSVIASARLAQQKNLGLLVGFCWRYHDGMRATFDQLAKGAIGPVLSVHTTYHTSTLARRPRRPEWSDMEFQLRNWWHFTWLSGDHIVEQAVHSVDRLSWALGDRIPERVTCLGGRAARSGPEHGNVYDNFSAIFEYPGGLRAFHTTRQIDSCPSDNSDYVVGVNGRCEINGWKPVYAIRDHAGKKVWNYSGPDDRDMYQTEHDELFASIRAGRPINDGERGANSTLLAIMARMAAYTGQTITWEQAMNSQQNLTPESLAMGPAPSAEIAIPGRTKFI